MGYLRYIDGDEGHFIFAGKLVTQGKAPYQDFFYQQMPLMPYIYAAWFWLTGVSWNGARLLTALISIFSTFIVGWCVFKESHKKYAAVAALLLMAACTTVFVWFSTVKVHALSFLLLIMAYAIWSYAPGRERKILRCVVGVLIAFSLNIRLMMLVVIPAFYLDLWLDKTCYSKKWPQALYFTLGLVLGCGMDYYFLAVCPECFFFDNIGYHAIRSGDGFIADFQQKLDIFNQVTGIGLKWGLSSFQQLVLTLASCGYFILKLAQKRITLSMSILILLTGVNLLPTPTFLQYFSVTIPFMVIQSVVFFTLLGPRLNKPLIYGLSAGLLVCGVLYLQAIPGAFQAFTFSAPANGEKTIPNMNATAKYIDSINPPDLPFLADWPGYYVASESPSFQGLENNFGFDAAKVISHELARKCKLILPRELINQLKFGNLLVVVRDPYIGDTLRRYNYLPHKRIGNSFIYLKKEQP